MINKVFNEDCLETMKRMPDKSIDLVLTDPPYGIKRFSQKDGGNSKKIKSFGDRDKNWNNIKPEQEIFEQIFRISKNQIIFGMNNFSLPESEYFIVWDKMQKMPSFAECELAWCSFKVPAKIIRRRFEIGKLHPAQKPQELFEYILKEYYKEESGIIYDPFMGSGTTAIACKSLGLDFIGSELDKDYFEIIQKRLSAVQGSLF